MSDEMDHPQNDFIGRSAITLPHTPSRIDLSTVKLEYHPGLQTGFSFWAESCGTTEKRLRAETGFRIRNQHHSAVLLENRRLADGTFLNIYELSMKKNLIFYSVEPNRILVRGYSWPGISDPDDVWGNGGFFPD